MTNRLSSKLAKYFYYTAKPEPLNPLHHLRAQNSRLSERQLRTLDGGKLCSYLDDVARASGSTGCDYSDYWMIFSTLQRLRPKCVLECGSGVSSIVFAYYARSVAGTRNAIEVVSVEESPDYHQGIIDIFPEDLAPYIQFKQRDRVEALYGEQRGCYYQDIPAQSFDFVFIDGPTDRQRHGHKGWPKCFCADFLNIISRADNPVSALLDQRIFTLQALRKLIRGGEINYLPTRALTLFVGISKRDLAPFDIFRAE